MINKIFFSCSSSSYHVVDDVDVVGDPAHLVTLLHVGPLWISSSQNRSVRVSLYDRQQQQQTPLFYFISKVYDRGVAIIEHHLHIFPIINHFNIVAVVSAHRFHSSVDGQQVWHPVVEPGSKVLRVDRHETLTLKTQNGWWRQHWELTHYKQYRGAVTCRNMAHVGLIDPACLLDNSNCFNKSNLLCLFLLWLKFYLLFCPANHHIIVTQPIHIKIDQYGSTKDLKRTCQ